MIRLQLGIRQAIGRMAQPPVGHPNEGLPPPPPHGQEPAAQQARELPQPHQDASAPQVRLLICCAPAMQKRRLVGNCPTARGAGWR